MDFIESYHIDLTESFCQQFMIDKMKQALKFVTCSNLKRSSGQDSFIYICQDFGPQCFICTWTRSPKTSTWSLSEPLQPHAKKCEKQGQAALFIKTMMLFKLRKEYFEDFIIENELIGKTPKNILLTYSRKRHNMSQPFYTAYLKDVEIIGQVKKKWANLMDAIRRSTNARNQDAGVAITGESLGTTAAVPGGGENGNPLTTFPESFPKAPVPIVPVLAPVFNFTFEIDKQNITDVKFDRVKQKPPEVIELLPRDSFSWPSAFGSLPTSLINSSVQKQSLRDFTDLQPSLFM